MGFKATVPTAARLAAAGLMIAGWAVSAGVACADPDYDVTNRAVNARSPPPSPRAGSLADGSTVTGGVPASGPKTIHRQGRHLRGRDRHRAGHRTARADPSANGTCYWKRTGNPDGNLIDNSHEQKAAGSPDRPDGQSVQDGRLPALAADPGRQPACLTRRPPVCRALSASSTGCSAARTDSSLPAPDQS